jgi:hypothetical protein
MNSRPNFDLKTLEMLQKPIGFTPVLRLTPKEKKLLFKTLGEPLLEQMRRSDAPFSIPVGPLLTGKLVLTDTVKRAHQVSGFALKLIQQKSSRPTVTLESQEVPGSGALICLATNIGVMATQRCRDRVLKLLSAIASSSKNSPRLKRISEPGNPLKWSISLPPDEQYNVTAYLMTIMVMMVARSSKCKDMLNRRKSRTK